MMKHPMAFVLTTAFVTCLSITSSPAFPRTDATPSRLNAEIQHNESQAADVVGVVTNVTFGASEHVSMQIKRDGEHGYRAVGKYDSKNLFGRFDVPGTLVNSRGADRCLQFEGSIEIGGDDGSGLSKVLKIPYVMSIYFSPTGAKGVYHISKAPDMGINFDQYGTMDLVVHGTLPSITE